MKQMSFMKRMRNNGIILLFILPMMFAVNASYVLADTDGTELQVIQAETLEVQLGEEWAGVQFQLMTDAGIYPEKIAVDADGILSLELGGSSKYTLSCLSSAVAVPEPAEEKKEDKVIEKDMEKLSDEKQENDIPASAKTVAGIPVIHIVIFSGGMVIAVAALLVMKVLSSHRHEEEDEYDD